MDCVLTASGHTLAALDVLDLGTGTEVSHCRGSGLGVRPHARTRFRAPHTLGGVSRRLPPQPLLVPISLPERPSPRRTRSPSSPRRHVDGRTRWIRVPKPRLGWCRRGLSGLSIADASLRVHISPSAKTASFSSKDRFGRCCKTVVVRLRAPGFAGVFASFPKVILQRVTTGAPPSCLLHLHASRRMHGMYG